MGAEPLSRRKATGVQRQHDPYSSIYTPAALRQKSAVTQNREPFAIRAAADCFSASRCSISPMATATHRHSGTV